MFSDPPSPRTEPANFSALKSAKTTIIPGGDYDVFGDGTVVIKSAPGHSPDHQVLFVKLAKTGPVVLSGDLYHYPEERALHRVPSTEFNREQTAASREAIEAFLKQTNAQLWIEHDFIGNGKLKKSPQYTTEFVVGSYSATSMWTPSMSDRWNEPSGHFWNSFSLASPSEP
jgi:glyoxylase-like metal-dependent hydrolase (beta-lactamase superfamily II)